MDRKFKKNETEKYILPKIYMIPSEFHMLEWIVLASIGIITLAIFIFLAYRDGFFKKDIVTFPNTQKISYCASNFQTAISASLILGESNNFFWEAQLIKESLEHFIDDTQSSMFVVLGPEFDLASETFLYTLAKGLLLKKIQVRVANTRNIHHIKYFELKDNKKIVISELPHDRLQNEREDFLVCTNRNDCSVLMKRYLDKAIANSEEVTYNNLFNKLKFIQWDETRKQAVTAETKDVDYIINRIRKKLMDIPELRNTVVLNNNFDQPKNFVPS